MDVCAVEYENIIYELLGIAHLLNCVANVMLEEGNEPMYRALQTLHSAVSHSAHQLEKFMEKQTLSN